MLFFRSLGELWTPPGKKERWTLLEQIESCDPLRCPDQFFKRTACSGDPVKDATGTRKQEGQGCRVYGREPELWSAEKGTQRERPLFCNSRARVEIGLWCS